MGKRARHGVVGLEAHRGGRGVERTEAEKQQAFEKDPEGWVLWKLFEICGSYRDVLEDLRTYGSESAAKFLEAYHLYPAHTCPECRRKERDG